VNLVSRTVSDFRRRFASQEADYGKNGPKFLLSVLLSGVIMAMSDRDNASRLTLSVRFCGPLWLALGLGIVEP